MYILLLLVSFFYLSTACWVLWLLLSWCLLMNHIVAHHRNRLAFGVFLLWELILIMSQKRPQEDGKARLSEGNSPDQDKRRRIPTLRKYTPFLSCLNFHSCFAIDAYMLKRNTKKRKRKKIPRGEMHWDGNRG